jgi:hypothetical protein
VEQDIYQRDSDGQVVMDETDRLNPEPKKQAGKLSLPLHDVLPPAHVEHFDDSLTKWWIAAG